MDAHPVSFTSAAERSNSRIWKDLSAYRHFAIVQKLLQGLQEDISGTVDMAAKIGKVHSTDRKLEKASTCGSVVGALVCGC